MVDENPWYSQLREIWRPRQVQLLLIAESAPDDHGDSSQRRFFYADHLGSADNLFRSVVGAMYGATKDDLRQTGKRPWLTRLQADGFYVIDLAPYPVNAASSQAARSRILRENVPGCIERARALNPDEVVVVKSNLYPMLSAPLRAAGLLVPQNAGIPFPLGNKRAEFVSAFNAARRGTGTS